MPRLPRQQLILFAFLLAATVGVLSLVYIFLLRTPMVPVYQNIRQSDASAIVAQLDKAGIAFRLENEGHDVLVPEDRASEARVAVAGSNVSLGGTVGFELFDNSDMGLTEFAQKINFQRAMQGELSRTIMAMQGVEYARVHLALPERSIFRATQGEPTAAVTIQMVKGRPLTDRRIEGIQQLVASSIPGLSQSAVSVLDENGDLVSALPAEGNSYGVPLDERSALAQYYEARASDTIRDAAPGIPFEVTANARQAAQAAGAAGETVGQGLPAREALILDITIRTPDPLASDIVARLDALVSDRLSLDRTRGDTLRFTTGPIVSAGASLDQRSPVRRTPATTAPRTPAVAASTDWPFGTSWRPWAMIAVILVIFALAVRPRRRLDEAQALTFAEQLKMSANERSDAHGG